MMISTRGRYALRVMIDLAEHIDEGYIPLQTIAKRQGFRKISGEHSGRAEQGGAARRRALAKGGGYRRPNRRRSIPRLRYCP